MSFYFFEVFRKLYSNKNRIVIIQHDAYSGPSNLSCNFEIKSTYERV